MTAPDPNPDALCAALHRAVTVIQRRQSIDAAIATLQAERAALDADLADTWPAKIDAVATELRAFADQTPATPVDPVAGDAPQS